MRKYDILIFDLDDTLFDFKASEQVALAKLFAAYQIEFIEKNINQYKEINHGLWKQLETGEISREDVLHTRFQTFLKLHHHDVDGKQVDERYRDLLTQEVHLLPDAITTLTQLKAMGYKLVAGTNGAGVTQKRRLTNSNLIEFFDELFISEELNVEKPHKAFFETIFTTCHVVDKRKILMIGDNIDADILGAIQSGIDSIWMNHLNKTATRDGFTHEVKSLKEVVALLTNEA